MNSIMLKILNQKITINMPSTFIYINNRLFKNNVILSKLNFVQFRSDCFNFISPSFQWLGRQANAILAIIIAIIKHIIYVHYTLLLQHIQSFLSPSHLYWQLYWHGHPLFPISIHRLIPHIQVYNYPRPNSILKFFKRLIIFILMS